MKYKLFIFILCMLFSCSMQTQKDPWKGYYPEDLEKAWRQKDTVTILKWINSLQDTSLSDTVFSNIVTCLGITTKFQYGLFDPDKEYYEIPLNIRNINKRNIIKVYQLYSRSTLFMHPVDWDKAILLQDRYSNDTADLSSDQIMQLEKAFDSLAKDNALPKKDS